MAGLDLLAKRAERTGWDDVSGTTPRTYPITAGDKTIATLGPELPLAVLEPLKAIDQELSLLFNKVLSAINADLTQAEIASQVMDFLVAYPDLPAKAVRIIGDVGKNLLGEEGFAEFLALRPSLQDVMALTSGITGWYGVSVGESSGSSDSAEEPDGTTSTPTSDDTSEDSTSETPSDPTPETPA